MFVKTKQNFYCFVCVEQTVCFTEYSVSLFCSSNYITDQPDETKQIIERIRVFKTNMEFAFYQQVSLNTEYHFISIFKYFNILFTPDFNLLIDFHSFYFQK